MPSVRDQGKRSGEDAANQLHDCITARQQYGNAQRADTNGPKTLMAKGAVIGTVMMRPAHTLFFKNAC
jgi:hypothetical protein